MLKNVATVFLTIFSGIYGLVCIMREGWVYILTNKHHTALYVGVTNNLGKRVWEHKTRQYARSFTARYNVDKLIYYEWFESIVVAIEREKYIKRKTRKWKEALIGKVNAEWRELSAPAHFGASS